MKKNIFTKDLSMPLNGSSTARIDIHAGDGNLIVDQQEGGGQLLASGTLQYLESQGAPVCLLEEIHGKAIFTLKGGEGKQPWFRLPWATCNGATEWQVHLNPAVPAEIYAHSEGGNIQLDLTEMTLMLVSTSTGGGNIDLTLPEQAASLRVKAETGAGNATVVIPSRMAARIQAATGLGKVIIAPRFIQKEKGTYKTEDYDGALYKYDITISSGAGNVIIRDR